MIASYYEPMSFEEIDRGVITARSADVLARLLSRASMGTGVEYESRPLEFTGRSENGQTVYRPLSGSLLFHFGGAESGYLVRTQIASAADVVSPVFVDYFRHLRVGRSGQDKDYAMFHEQRESIWSLLGGREHTTKALIKKCHSAVMPSVVVIDFGDLETGERRFSKLYHPVELSAGLALARIQYASNLQNKRE